MLLLEYSFTDIKTYFFSILTEIQDQQLLKDVSSHWYQV